ncbi:uncharacterized protein si:dkey-196h17.9 [Amphiprion ocellaris]|uniref:uncharacterized protein si:dkey-196h17.9 n=1 Tax=Amphiprion ocellaris TaxID=80972 RepID=UPI00241118BB|nr:uncharacterized protein si:dkey-196h17.9 [Amphiprion ocellaris]
MVLVPPEHAEATRAADSLQKENSADGQELEMLQGKMRKFISAVKDRKKPKRSDSKKCLVEKNNNNLQDGYTVAEPLVQNTVNTEEEEHLQQEKDVFLQELFELLGKYSDATTPEDGSCCSGRHDMQQRVVHLVRRFLSQIFPKPPADLDQNLQLHLSDMEKEVLSKFERFGPLFESKGLMRCLVDCYNRHTFNHLHSLVQNVSSFKSSFVLMNWVVHTYLSHEVLGRHDDQLFSQWEEQAKEKLLEHAQKEIRETLKRILQNESGQRCCNSEEAYVRLYLDTIQYVAAMPREAARISSELRDQVQDVCFRELLPFVTRYAAEQKEFLGGEAKVDQPQTIHFLRTLKTCKELRQHVLTEGKEIETSLLIQTLEDIEAFTLKLLMKIVDHFAESHLKKYFKSNSKRLYLFATLENLFPRLWYVLDEQNRVINEAYKSMAHVYLKHLLQSSRRKLQRCWNPDVEQTVQEDAEHLHRIMANLAPGVQQWNRILLKIPDVVECKDIDALKITMAHIEKDCNEQRKDLELLPALLRWKGLSKREVMEVMEALPGSRPRTGSGSWFSCLTCCIQEPSVQHV